MRCLALRAIAQSCGGSAWRAPSRRIFASQDAKARDAFRTSNATRPTTWTALTASHRHLGSCAAKLSRHPDETIQAGVSEREGCAAEAACKHALARVLPCSQDTWNGVFSSSSSSRRGIPDVARTALLRRGVALSESAHARSRVLRQMEARRLYLVEEHGGARWRGSSRSHEMRRVRMIRRAWSWDAVSVSATVHLPSSLPRPADLLVYDSERLPQRSKKEAKCAAAFLAAMSLHVSNMFDDYFFPHQDCSWARERRFGRRSDWRRPEA